MCKKKLILERSICDCYIYIHFDRSRKSDPCNAPKILTFGIASVDEKKQQLLGKSSGIQMIFLTGVLGPGLQMVVWYLTNLGILPSSILSPLA
jgi:hypothetical protein